MVAEPRKTIARPRNESKEDKKARKQQVKEERQARRVSKKSTKEQFSTEMKHQKRNLPSTNAPKMRKL
jgi:protein LTV1